MNLLEEVTCERCHSWRALRDLATMLTASGEGRGRERQQYYTEALAAIQTNGWPYDVDEHEHRISQILDAFHIICPELSEIGGDSQYIALLDIARAASRILTEHHRTYGDPT